MTKLSSSEVAVLVKAFSAEGHPQKVIVAKVKKAGGTVSQSTISRILRSDGEKWKACSENRKPKPRTRPRPVRSKTLIRKVNQLTSKENPPSQYEMSRRLGASRTTIQNIINMIWARSKEKRSKFND